MALLLALGASLGHSGYEHMTAAKTLTGVDPARSAEFFALGQSLGLDQYNPSWTNWDVPLTWKGQMSKGEGYFIMLFFAGMFTLATMGLTYIEGKFAGIEMTSEHFNTAGRNVKTGLTASVIVSQWTWAATLLQSSNVAWQYGVTGPFWYAAGASIQILLFGIIAIEIKRKAPNAHTVLELVDVRWGNTAHSVFMFFCIATQTIVSSMLMLGGTSTMLAMAGIDIWISGFLIPLGVMFYTLTGGLKATFLASYMHTSIIFVTLVIMVTLVYMVELPCTEGEECVSLGSASIVYERLRFVNALPLREGDACGRPAAFWADSAAMAADPVCTATKYHHTVSDAQYNFIGTGLHQGPAVIGSENPNRGGSYLTMMSLDGLQFGIINIVGNFGTVFVDQSYWQSAIAARPASAHKGYLLGGMCWFTIPFALATSLGLGSNALNMAVTGDDAGSGLVPFATSFALGGKGLQFLMVITLFVAITSTASAEAIAMGGIYSYDIYRKYINPMATGSDIKKQSQIMVVVWCFMMFLFNGILDAMGLGLGWVYNFMGICIGSAVCPIAACILWDKTDGWVAILSAVVGFIGAVMTWLITAASLYDEVSEASLGMLYAQLAGNCVAIGLSGIIMVVLSFMFPQNYDWSLMNQSIKLVEQNTKVSGEDWESTPEFLAEASAWIFKYGWAYTLFLCIGWPLIAAPWGVFPEAVYSLWASVAVCWGYLAAIVIIGLPLYENSATIIRVITMQPFTFADSEAQKAQVSATTSEPTVQSSC